MSQETEINKDEVVKKLRDMTKAYAATGNHSFATLFRDAADLIEEQKTGKWEEYGEPNAYGKFEIWYHKCNLCGAIGIREFSYCPNCGARMVNYDS